MEKYRLKTIIEKRFLCLANVYPEKLQEYINCFAYYDIFLYDSNGNFNYFDFKYQCIHAIGKIHNENENNKETLYPLLAIIQSFMGIRQFSEFLIEINQYDK